jgi:AraC family transcriptional regulator, regulatory protein of adaptative response / methylated-DNA-[protein]-cysteine methyltransferase
MESFYGPETTFEAVTSNKGLVVFYGFHPTPFGEALIAMTNVGVCALFFVDKSQSETLEELRSTFKGASFTRDQVQVAVTAQHVFSKDPSASGPYNIHLRGTPFQLKVWEALSDIPKGTTMTYADIAEKISRPKAQRAVGTAVGKNPVAYIIPCHRVIRKSGDLGNYRWGTERKRLILESEGVEL